MRLRTTQLDSAKGGCWQRLPIVLGVTGHLNLPNDAVAELEKAVCACFREIKEAYPASPLVLLSPLAEGADRLVARQALANSIRLVAPLPLPRAEYLKDFATAESRTEFEELYACSDPAFELPLLGGYTEQQVRQGGIARDTQYAHVGAYIVRHSQILLALWNGLRHQPENVGGTAQIVDFALHGVTAPFAPIRTPLDPLEPGGLIYHITTGTPGHPTLAQPLGTIQQLPANAYERQRRKSVLKHMTDFSHDCSTLGPKLQRRLASNMNSLLPEVHSADLPTELRLARQHYAVADTLAQHFLRRTRSAHHLILLLFGLAVLLFEVYVHFESYVEMGRSLVDAIAASLRIEPGSITPAWVTSMSPWLSQPRGTLLLYLAATGIAWSIFQVASRRRYQAKYLDYRALAEGLRVQFFWRLAGIGGVDESVADHYLSHQASELDWIRLALRAWSVPLSDPTADTGLDRRGSDVADERLELVNTYWLNDQQQYFVESATAAQAALKRHRRVWTVLLWLSLAATVVQVYVNQPHALLILLITISLAVVGLDREAIETRGTAEHVRAYTRMAALYTNAMRAVGQPGASQEVLTELGCEALTENAEWLVLHRDRPIQLPAK